MPSDLRADDLQQSVYDQFMTIVPILLQRENRFPTAANTIVLLKSEGPEDDAALAGMVEAQFKDVLKPFEIGFMGRIDNCIEFRFPDGFFKEMAMAISLSENYRRSSIAAILPALQHLRTLILHLLESKKGTLEDEAIYFAMCSNGGVRLTCDRILLGSFEGERYLGKMQNASSFKVPNIPAIQLALQSEEVQVGHDLFTKVAEVVKEAGSVVKARSGDENLIQIKKISCECLCDLSVVPCTNLNRVLQQARPQYMKCRFCSSSTL